MSRLRIETANDSIHSIWAMKCPMIHGRAAFDNLRPIREIRRAADRALRHGAVRDLRTTPIATAIDCQRCVRRIRAAINPPVTRHAHGSHRSRRRAASISSSARTVSARSLRVMASISALSDAALCASTGPPGMVARCRSILARAAPGALILGGYCETLGQSMRSSASTMVGRLAAAV